MTLFLENTLSFIVKVLLLLLPLFIATWFSPMLIALNGYPLLKAIKSSIAGMLQYTVPMSVSWLVMTVGMLVVMLGLGLVIGILGALIPMLAQLLMPLLLQGCIQGCATSLGLIHTLSACRLLVATLGKQAVAYGLFGLFLGVAHGASHFVMAGKSVRASPHGANRQTAKRVKVFVTQTVFYAYAAELYVFQVIKVWHHFGNGLQNVMANGFPVITLKNQHKVVTANVADKVMLFVDHAAE
ncbi:conserved hypothetical protein [Ricinus communis]|uniref:Uncharacterized protein n=1 Tax=Ricinus communis TaxID=3988 RepID=B9TPQ0_RICCO|nr:conserved hypothetical protein [Ricinus communis]